MRKGEKAETEEDQKKIKEGEVEEWWRKGSTMRKETEDKKKGKKQK
jgi:hypothetical protein